MRKWIFVFDIITGLLLICIMSLNCGGCTHEQIAAVSHELTNPSPNTVALISAVGTVAATQATNAVTLGWPVWTILIFNVVSSLAGAIVGSTKKTE